MRSLITLVERAALTREDPRSEPGFARWFAGSKVVDGKGRPLVCYHGTTDEIGVFRSASHFGTHVAANQRVGYRSKALDAVGGHVIPVYLRICNPLRVEDQEASVEATLHRSICQGRFANIDRDTSWREGANAAVQAAGHDGLVYENRAEDRGRLSWVIFRPEQAKSALSNSGEYSDASGQINEHGGWGGSGTLSTSFVPQPRLAFHGTSEAAWEAMRATGTMTSGRRRGISFTTSRKVAQRFAALAAGRDHSDRGVVIAFDLDALVRDHKLAAYKDRHTGALWDVGNEREMKAPTRSIPDIGKYILRHEFIDPEVAARALDAQF